MFRQDPVDIKKRIVDFIKQRGPSLPVHIAKEISMSILFTSVFLSELVSDKEIKISFMRVGNSPVYFVDGQEGKLENFSEHLQNKEKEALSLLKEKKFLKDREQEPAIRVALREIKDFALPFKTNDEIYWRYYLVPETEIKEEKIPVTRPKKILQKKEKKKEPETVDKSKNKEEEKKDSKPEQIKENVVEIVEPVQKPATEKKQAKKKPVQKQNENFFDKVKEFLSKESIEILDIESFSKNELMLRAKEKEREELIVAYNKKRIKDEDLIKAAKKATDLNLSYIVLSFGEIPRKLKELLIATKNLSKIDTIK